MKPCIVLAWAVLGIAGCKEEGAVVAAQFAKAQIDTARVQIRSLRDGVARYQVLKGTPPRALDELVKEKVLHGDRLPKDPWGEPYVYTLRADGEYEIYSMGPDRKAGTDDDVTLR
jgi:hypothetical protein